VDPAIAAGLARAFVGEVEALRPGQGWADQAPTAVLKATTGAQGWRIWQTLAGRLIDGTAGSGDQGDRLALLGQAINGQTTVSIETLRTWFGVEDRSDLPPGGQ
jgi:hypothetical protein